MEMSQLITASRSDVLPGHKLSWFRASMLTELAKYFEERQRESLLLQAASLMRRAEREVGESGDPNETNEGRAANAINGVLDNIIRGGSFGVGRYGFRQMVTDVSNLPMMLWTSLRVTEEKITLIEATNLITPSNENKIHEALLELMGYVLEKKTGTWVLDRKNLEVLLTKFLPDSQNPANTPSSNSGT